MGIRRSAVEVSEADRAQLAAWLRSQTIAHGLAVRAQIVLGSATGESIRALAERLKVTQRTVCLWRRRYASQGLDGLRNRPRAGRPRRITSAKEQAVVSATLCKPKNATHWSTPAVGQGSRFVQGCGASHLAEVWSAAAPGRDLQVQPRSTQPSRDDRMSSRPVAAHAVRSTASTVLRAERWSKTPASHQAAALG